jgi:hypothetical protein
MNEDGEIIIIGENTDEIPEEGDGPGLQISVYEYKEFDIEALNSIIERGNIEEVCSFLRFCLLTLTVQSGGTERRRRRVEISKLLTYIKENNLCDQARKILDDRSSNYVSFLCELMEEGTRPRSVKCLFRSGMYNNYTTDQDIIAKTFYTANRWGSPEVALHFIDQCSVEAFERHHKRFCVLFGVFFSCRNFDLFKKIAKLKKGNMRCHKLPCSCDYNYSHLYLQPTSMYKIRQAKSDAKEYTRKLLRMKLLVLCIKHSGPFLPDYVLLHIFRFIVDETEPSLPSFLSLSV